MWDVVVHEIQRVHSPLKQQGLGLWYYSLGGGMSICFLLCSSQQATRRVIIQQKIEQSEMQLKHSKRKHYFN